MKRYKICILDETGHSDITFHIALKDDVAALKECKSLSPGHCVELWDDACLIARIEPKKSDAASSGRYQA